MAQLIPRLKPIMTDHSPELRGTATGRAMVSSKRTSWLLVLNVYLLMIMWGMMEIGRPTPPMINVLWSLAMCSVMNCWCVFDARRRGRPLIQSLHWIVFFLWPVAVPIYLLWSRRLWGMAVAVIHAIGLIVASLAACLAVRYLIGGHTWPGALPG